MSKFERIRNSKLIQGANARKNAVLAGVLASPTLIAFAQADTIDTTGMAVDQTAFMGIAGILLVGGLAFWGVKKGLRFFS